MESNQIQPLYKWDSEESQMTYFLAAKPRVGIKPGFYHKAQPGGFFGFYEGGFLGFYGFHVGFINMKVYH